MIPDLPDITDTQDADLEPLWRSSWAQIKPRAWWLLKHSADLAPANCGARVFHGIPRLCLWCDEERCSSERSAFTLSVFELPGPDYRSRHPVVREAVWRRQDDLRRVYTDVSRTRECAVFEPTISVRDGSVPANELAALLEEATSFRVPVVWLAGSQGLITGIGSRGFEFFSREQPSSVLRLEWSFEPPATWRLILDWAAKLEEFLLNCFPPADNTSVVG
jgi:hypothetical protein